MGRFIQQHGIAIVLIGNRQLRRTCHHPKSLLLLNCSRATLLACLDVARPLRGWVGRVAEVLPALVLIVRMVSFRVLRVRLVLDPVVPVRVMTVSAVSVAAVSVSVEVVSVVRPSAVAFFGTLCIVGLIQQHDTPTQIIIAQHTSKPMMLSLDVCVGPLKVDLGMVNIKNRSPVHMAVDRE